METICASPEYKAKMSAKQRKLWDNPEYSTRQRKIMMAGMHIRPNKPETIIANLLNVLQPNQWQYTGDGTKIIGGRNPDFWNGDHRLIELFGDHWHSPKAFPDKLDEQGLIAHYANRGYKCLIIWERELKQPEGVVDKIMEYVGAAQPT